MAWALQKQRRLGSQRGATRGEEKEDSKAQLNGGAHLWRCDGDGEAAANSLGVGSCQEKQGRDERREEGKEKGGGR